MCRVQLCQKFTFEVETNEKQALSVVSDSKKVIRESKLMDELTSLVRYLAPVASYLKETKIVQKIFDLKEAAIPILPMVGADSVAEAVVLSNLWISTRN